MTSGLCTNFTLIRHASNKDHKKIVRMGSFTIYMLSLIFRNKLLECTLFE